MLTNFANEAIILVASITVLVVLQQLQRSMDAFIDTKLAAIMAVVATLVLFGASKSDVVLLVLIIALAVISIKTRQNTVVSGASFTLLVAGWIIFIIRTVSKSSSFTFGFQTGKIPSMAILLVAVIATIISMITRRVKPSKVEDSEEDDDDDEDPKPSIFAKLFGAIKERPATAYLCTMITIVLVIFAVKVITL